MSRTGLVRHRARPGSGADGRRSRRSPSLGASAPLTNLRNRRGLVLARYVPVEGAPGPALAGRCQEAALPGCMLCSFLRARGGRDTAPITLGKDPVILLAHGTE